MNQELSKLFDSIYANPDINLILKTLQDSNSKCMAIVDQENEQAIVFLNGTEAIQKFETSIKGPPSTNPAKEQD